MATTWRASAYDMTLPPVAADTPNERVQDAIDILLFREEFADDATRVGLREACEDIFKARGTHGWPPDFDPTAHRFRLRRERSHG